jgi:hypothetical protein
MADCLASWRHERTLGQRHGINTFRTFASQAFCLDAGITDTLNDNNGISDPVFYKFQNAFNPVRACQSLILCKRACNPSIANVPWMHPPVVCGRQPVVCTLHSPARSICCCESRIPCDPH